MYSLKKIKITNQSAIWMVVCILFFSIIPPTYAFESNEFITYDDEMDNNSFFVSELRMIQKAIINNNVSWVANVTSIISSKIDVKNICGSKNETFDDIEFTSLKSSILADAFDWRDINGTNWVTSVKNQGGCGSCVAFGTLSALESVVQIEAGSVFDCDLSEAYLFFCGDGGCDLGWYVSEATSFVRKNGVPDESCFPYQARDMDCDSKESNWQKRLVTVETRGAVRNNRDIKEALVTYGPLVTTFDVYADFQAYSSGIYEHVWGDYQGGHAVAIVGYNDDPGYWICKNSWGSGWGEDGFFNIKYDECGIDDTAFYFSGIGGNLQPSVPSNPVPSAGETYVDTLTVLSWDASNDLNGDKVTYTIYLSEGRTISEDDVIAENIYDNFIEIELLDKFNYYSWMVIATDEVGSQHKSPVWHFQTRLPHPPMIEGPTEVRVNRESTFTGVPSDMDGEEYFWFFDWGDGETSGWLGPAVAGEAVTAAHVWSKKGVYTVKLRYKEDGVMSEWGYLEISLPHVLDVGFLDKFYELFPFFAYSNIDFYL